MAYFLNHLNSLFTSLAFFSLLIFQSTSAWSPTVATWYGNPSGGGSDGGACGFTNTVEQAPFSKMVAAGGSSVFQSGTGCGACYQVKCTSNPACSGNPVTITITDECPGSCGAFQFDLSGTAFGAMAASGRADALRNAGKLQIQYQRVPCQYPGTTVAFRVDNGSNPFYFATAIEYEDGDGDLAGVQLRNTASNSNWLPMQHSWGAVWKFNSGSAMNGPLSLRLTTSSGKTLVATNVIPAGWRAGATYWSRVNFGS